MEKQLIDNEPRERNRYPNAGPNVPLDGSLTQPALAGRNGGSNLFGHIENEK